MPTGFIGGGVARIIGVDAAIDLLRNHMDRCSATASRACGWERRIAKRSGNIYWQHSNGGRAYGKAGPLPLWHPKSFMPMVYALTITCPGRGNTAVANAMCRIAQWLNGQEPVVRTPMSAALLALAEQGLLWHDYPQANDIPDTRN